MADAAVPVWEETTPVDESAVPVWEETTPVDDNRFAPTRRNWELMRQSFRGDDPLAFIDDPQLRENMRFITGQSENPDEERKKWALASYFSQNIHADIRFCHGNLDSLIAKFNNNEPQSIDNAYRDIGAALGVQQRDRAWFENSTAGAAISGTAKTLNTFFIEPPAFLSKLWVAANTAQMNAQLFRTSVFNPEAAKEIRDPLKSGEAVEAMIRNLYTEYYAPVEEAAWRDANVPDDWMTNSDSLGNWCRNAALSLVNYLPQLAMQTGLMAATGGVSALGTVYGISGYYDIKDDHPEMSEADAVVYGVGVGLINGVLEKVTLGIIDGKVSKKVAEAGIKKGIMQAARHFGWNASKEGAEEGLEEFAQNLLDIAMGLRGDTGEWKSSDWWREMRRGVPESAFLGFATGGPLAFDSYRNLRQVALRRETIRSTISDRVEELSAKDSLSAREEQELEELQTVMDAGNPADMEKAVRDVYEREVIRNQEEVNRREHEADRREEQEELELTDDEILLRNAQRAERNQRLRRNLPHNPQETVETATELLRDFPEISLDIVYSIDELPEPVRAKIDAEGLDSNRIRAWVDEDSDIVHLIADRVRPSEVGRVIGHEVIGHKGLRAVFGERFDSLLDLVYRDHFEEVAKLGDRYHRDTETLENRRYLTEEFLAECADAKVKPSWWKEFLGFVRQQLRRILPKMRFTDADIEAALSRSARAMRRINRSGRNAEIGVRFAVKGDENTFHGIYDKADAREKETIDAYRYAMTGAPVVELSGNEFQKDNIPITDKVTAYFEEECNGVAVNSEIGAVRLDREGVKDSLGHGIGRIKAAAYAAVPQIIENGKICDRQENWKGRGYDTVVIVAPLEIAGKPYIGEVVVKQGTDRQGFYLHEVELKEKLENASKTANGSAFPASHLILSQLLDKIKLRYGKNDNNLNFSIEDEGESENPVRFSVAPPDDSAAFQRWFADSKVVDAEGKPLVVYHGTDSYKEFFTFKIGKKGNVGPGIYLAADKNLAQRYADKSGIGDGRVYELYAKIEKPLRVTNLAEPGKEILKAVYGERKGESLFAKRSSSDVFGQNIIRKNDIEKLKELGYDGIIWGNSKYNTEYIVFSPTQIKSATENVGTFDPENPDIRFSLGEFSEADQRDIVAILQPYTGMNTEREPVDYRKYLAEHGVEISEQDAWEFALEAVRQNIAFARKRSEERRNQWLYENYPLYKECVDFCGSADFKIKPSIRFSGEAFSGSWISPEFVKYSEKRKRGPKETDSSYRRYQERREAALARAEGTASDEIAESIARRTGRDTLEVEQELIDFFRDLKKRDFYHEYTNFREEQILGDKQEARAAFDEWIQEEEKRIQNEVVELLEQGRPITAEWIGENKKIFDELYRQLFDGKTPPGKVGKADLEAINAAIMQQGSNAATFAQAYKVAREKAYGEFMEKLRAFRDKVMAANADAISLQRDAVSFAEQNLPAESRGEFTRGILKLMEYSTAPTGKYPEGRRMREFRSLVERMVNRAGELRKTTAQNEIREMLDAVKVKRNYKGIATAVIPSEQERVERIRRVIDMNIATLAKAVDANNEQIMKLEESGEDSALLKKYQEDNQLLEMFGDLEHRSANDVEEAAEKLKNIIFGGKMAFFDLLSKRRDRINDMRSRALDDITFGKLETFTRVDPEYFTKYWLKNQSLGTLMRLASGKSIQDFDNSVFGELYREVEDSTQTEQTALRRMQRDFDEALRTICGVDGNYVARMKKKGKFFRMISEVNENSGVFKTEFSREVDLESKKHPNKLLEHGRRAVLRKFIPVEDSKFHGETREGARSLLRRIDNGEAITEWDGFLLDDITIDFLRQQLADFDAGLEQSYEIFNEKQDDENFNRLLADARKEAQLMLLSHSRRESRHRAEVPLSQGAALQLLLTWEQEGFRPNMKWNGWSEESMRQIKAFLKPEVLRMGYWMRDYIARNQKQLDAAVSKRYGAHLPGIENYFPGVFKGQNSRAVESEFGRGYGTMSINPNFLISRKFHLKPADMDADAFTTFFGNQINQAHFLAWSDTIRDLNAVYGSMRVKNAINNNFGRGVEENIRERIAVLAQGGDPRGDGYIARLFGKMFRNWVPAKIAVNQSSVIKQMLGVVSYMNHVPVKDFVKYSVKANFSNPEFREFVRWAKNSDYMKNRLAGGLDRDLSYLLNYTRDSRAYSPLSEGLLDLGTWGTRWADAWSTLHGGYAVYMYALEQARRDGKTEAEAREAARRAWMRATDETQQSGYLKDQNYFQSNQGGYRYLTAFMSNPIQTMNLQIQTFHELRYGRDKKASLQKLCRQILINHLIVPSLMIATTDLIRHGFDLGEWWDDLEWEDYLVGWLLGSFESLFLFGKVLGNVGNYAMDRIVGRKRPFYQSIVAFPMVEDISYDIGFLSKLIDSDKPVTEKEVFSSIRALGDFLMAGGIADRFAPLGPVGAILHAVGTQGKRIAGWFEEK